MKKILSLSFVFLFFTSGLIAQDTLWIKQKEGKPYLIHKVKNGETLFLLSKKYAVPPALLADVNDVNYQDGLPAGSKFRIPVDNYNYIRIESVVKSKPIYYHTGEEDDLRSISRLFNIPQSALQRWNKMDNPDLEQDQVLQVGWIVFDQTQIPFVPPATAPLTATVTVPQKTMPAVKKVPQPPVTKESAPVLNHTDSTREITAFEELYYQQAGGVNVTEESGAAVFYPLKTKAGPGVYYAFHNTALRGSVLKIMNPANGKIIYAKVIGTLPNLKEYHNAIVGLSSNAARVMGARDQRMFCKLKYR